MGKKKAKEQTAPAASVADQGDKGPYIPALDAELAGKRYDVNTTSEKVYKRNWLIRIISIVLVILLLIMAIGYCSVSILNRAGRFTVKMMPNEYGISLSEFEDFSEPTLNLHANPIESMDNITKEWILNKNNELGDGNPVYQDFSEIDKVWGDHNGENYLAYTFGIKNASADADDVISYKGTLNILYEYLGADEAIRVMVFKNGTPTIYAKPATDSADGEEKLEAFEADQNFLSDDIVMVDEVKGFKVGDVIRYTVVVWLEGEDPECVNDIMGGEVKLSMDFEVLGGKDAADLSE